MVFSNDKKQPLKRRGASAHETAVTILTSGCHFEGKLFCKGSSRIGGKIEGEILSEGLLIIEEEAQITANIKAEEAIIQGRVKGRVEARDRVELTPTCLFEGDIITPHLVVQEGACFNGNATMPKDRNNILGIHEENNSKTSKKKNSDPPTSIPEIGIR